MHRLFGLGVATGTTNLSSSPKVAWVIASVGCLDDVSGKVVSLLTGLVEFGPIRVNLFGIDHEASVPTELGRTHRAPHRSTRHRSAWARKYRRNRPFRARLDYHCSDRRFSALVTRHSLLSLDANDKKSVYDLSTLIPSEPDLGCGV